MDVERDRDRQVGRLLRQSMASGPTSGTPETCLDAEVLAAWVDGGLNSEGRARVERHVSDCARCRALTATFVISLPAVDAVEAPAPWWWEGWRRRWLVPLAAGVTAMASGSPFLMTDRDRRLPPLRFKRRRPRSQRHRSRHSAAMPGRQRHPCERGAPDRLGSGSSKPRTRSHFGRGPPAPLPECRKRKLTRGQRRS